MTVPVDNNTLQLLFGTQSANNVANGAPQGGAGQNAVGQNPEFLNLILSRLDTQGIAPLQNTGPGTGPNAEDGNALNTLRDQLSAIIADLADSAGQNATQDTAQGTNQDINTQAGPLQGLIQSLSNTSALTSNAPNNGQTPSSANGAESTTANNTAENAQPIAPADVNIPPGLLNNPILAQQLGLDPNTAGEDAIITAITNVLSEIGVDINATPENVITAKNVTAPETLPPTVNTTDNTPTQLAQTESPGEQPLTQTVTEPQSVNIPAHLNTLTSQQNVAQNASPVLQSNTAEPSPLNVQTELAASLNADQNFAVNAATGDAFSLTQDIQNSNFGASPADNSATPPLTPAQLVNTQLANAQNEIAQTLLNTQTVPTESLIQAPDALNAQIQNAEQQIGAQVQAQTNDAADIALTQAQTPVITNAETFQQQEALNRQAQNNGPQNNAPQHALQNAGQQSGQNSNNTNNNPVPGAVPQSTAASLPPSPPNASQSILVANAPLPTSQAISADLALGTGSASDFLQNGDFANNFNASGESFDSDLLQQFRQDGLNTSPRQATQASYQVARIGAQAAQVVRAAITNVVTGASNAVESLSLELEPARLGRVQVDLNVNEDGVLRAHVTAERTDALHALQRDSNALTKALQDAGLDVGSDSFSFDLRDEANEQFARENDGTLFDVSGANGIDGDDIALNDNLAALAYGQQYIRPDGVNILA